MPQTRLSWVSYQDSPTLVVQRAKGILLARGSVESEQFLERRTQDPILRLVTELRLELPYDFALQQYDQILADFSSRIAPEIS